MDEDVKAEVRYYDNGDWNDPFVYHYCLPGCRCGRTEPKARACTWGVVLKTVGPNCPLALEYRWKHMEEANGWHHIGRAQHNLSLRGLSAAFTRGVVEDAEAEMARLQALNRDNVHMGIA